MLRSTLRRWLVSLAAFACALAGALPWRTAAAGDAVIVANRGSGTISVIDSRRDVVVGTFVLPALPDPPEPMYVVATPAHNRVFVGDRKSNCVVVFDGRDFSIEDAIPTGNGVFHMEADASGSQLWVVNDVDKTATVIDPRELEVLATVPMPADLVALGAVPHDVILDPQGTLAYVSLFLPGAPAGGNDVVVQYETLTFAETGRAVAGELPHMSFNRHADAV